jgi:hypothetical protein
MFLTSVRKLEQVVIPLLSKLCEENVKRIFLALSSVVIITTDESLKRSIKGEKRKQLQTL